MLPAAAAVERLVNAPRWVTPTPGRTLLFQYGSNMAAHVLREKLDAYLADYAPAGTTGELTLLGAARLVGWRFTVALFSATGGHRVADISEGDSGDEVWGALYELPIELVRRSDGARSVLDRIEGHRTARDPENYVPLEIDVEVGDVRARAWTYIGRDDARERCARDHPDSQVARSYAESILTGAQAIGVPAWYLAHVEATLAGTA